MIPPPAVSSVPGGPGHLDRSAGVSDAFGLTSRVAGSRGHLTVPAHDGGTDVQPSSRAAVAGPRLISQHPEDPVRRPDAHHIAAVRDSFWLLGDVDLLSQRFDARLACMTPRAEGAFVRLFPRGAERFVTALLRAVDALGADPAPEPGTDADSQLRALAARLLSAGMLRADFVHVGSSLQRAVRDSYAQEWTDDLDAAWTAVRDWLVAGLQSDQPGHAAVALDAPHPVVGVDLAARLDRLAAHAG